MELHIALIQYIMMYGKNVLKFFSRITDVQLKTTCTYSVSSYSVHSSFYSNHGLWGHDGPVIGIQKQQDNSLAKLYITSICFSSVQTMPPFYIGENVGLQYALTPV